jgi:hypothetical protein
VTVGSRHTKLIILRGNSGSGKGATAAGLRARYGRGLAIIGLSDRWSVVNVSDLVRYVASMYVT